MTIWVKLCFVKYNNVILNMKGNPDLLACLGSMSLLYLIWKLDFIMQAQLFKNLLFALDLLLGKKRLFKTRG